MKLHLYKENDKYVYKKNEEYYLHRPYSSIIN